MRKAELLQLIRQLPKAQASPSSLSLNIDTILNRMNMIMEWPLTQLERRSNRNFMLTTIQLVTAEFDNSICIDHGVDLKHHPTIEINVAHIRDQASKIEVEPVSFPSCLFSLCHHNKYVHVGSVVWYGML